MDPGLRNDVALKAYFDFLVSFSRSCFYSEPYAWACFHMLIGSMRHIRRLRIVRGDDWLDPRIHVAYLADSASGKGVGASFLQRVTKRLGTSVYNATDFTDAALIGTIRTTDDGEPVVHKGLLSGYTHEWLEDKQAMEPRPIDILYVSEASKVLEPRPGPSDALIMNSLQIAMNPYGTPDNLVTKKLAEGPSVSYGTDVTLFLTTFLPVSFADVVLKRGLFQRTLMIVKQSHHKERVEVTKEFFRSFYMESSDVYHNPITGEVGDKSTDDIIDMVVKVIREADRWAKGVESISISDDAAKRLEKLVVKFHDQVQGLSPFLQAKIHEFIARLAGHLVKLAAHVAILNKSEIVEEDHVIAIEHLHAPQRFEDLITYLSNNVEEPKEFTVRVQKELRCILSAQEDLSGERRYTEWHLGRVGWRHKPDLIQNLSRSLRLPRSGIKDLVDRHITWGNVEEKKDKSGRSFVRLNPRTEVEKNGKT